MRILWFTLLWDNINIKITQYNSVNVKWPNSQINKLNSTTKNVTEITLKLWSNMISNSNDMRLTFHINYY